MKTYLLLLILLGLVTLTGCAADDLTGPDAATDDAVALAQAPQDGPAQARRPASLLGAWRASDRFGSVTLFLDQVDAKPSPGPITAQTFSGKGIISGHLDGPIAVLVKGQYKGEAIAFSLSDARGETIAKAEGEIAAGFSLIKVVLLDGDDNERVLVFDRF